MENQENNESNIIPSFNPEKYTWIRKRLPIDALNLDQEIMELPTLIQEAAELSATAIEIREALKEELDRVLAQAGEQLRKVPTPSGKTRSETAIASQIYLSSEVEEKQKELGAARHDAALWMALVNSLGRKDSSIRVTADLLNSGFLSADHIMRNRRKDIRNVKVEMES